MESKTQSVFKRTNISSSSEIQELDRQDGAEKITGAKKDSRTRHDLRREAENTSAPHKGSACVKMRSSRAAPVCLVLLCGALFTAVIVLAVNLHNMIEEFYIKNKNTTDEIQDLDSQKNILNDNVRKMKENQEKLTKENKTLQEDIGNVKKQLKNKMVKWKCYQSNLYFISSEKKSWTESRRYCTERGADLIIINNREEQEDVKKISGDSEVWIGLNDTVAEGSWKWVDGNVTSGFSLWKSQRPNRNRQNDEDCAATDSSGWTDYQCDRALKWICEKKIA